MKNKNEVTISCPHCKGQFPLSLEYIENIKNEAMTKLSEERIKMELKLTNELNLKLEKYKKTAKEEIRNSLEKELNEKKSESELQAEVLREQNIKLIDELTGLRKNMNDVIKEKQKGMLELEAARKDQQLLIERSTLEAIERQKHILEDGFSQQIEKMNFNNQLQLKEKELKLQELQNKIENLQKSSHKVDSRISGEAMELAAEDILNDFASSHNDMVNEIKKGVNGSDYNYLVLNEKAKEIGKVTIEVKRTEKFQNSFIEKALEDMKKEQSSYAIICATNLPKAYERITIIQDKLFVMGPIEFKHFLKIMRKIIVDENRSSIIANSKISLKDKVFSLVTSKEFISQLNSLHKNLCSLSGGIEADYKKIESALKKRRLECDRSIELLVDTFLNLHNTAPNMIEMIESLELSE